MAVGKELKRIREASNMSAEKLAKIIGVNGERLRKWEQKDMTPRHDDTAKIEKFFNVQIDELFKIKRVPNVPSISNLLAENDETLHYKTKDELIKSLQETVEIQKKYINLLEQQAVENIANKDGLTKKSTRKETA